MATQRRFYVWIAFIFSSFPVASQALTLPASTDPSRVQQQVNTPLMQPASPEMRGMPAAPTSSVTQAVSNIKFVLKQLEIVGNTVYSRDALLPLYQSYLGRSISLADLQSIARAITLKYRKDGYVLSRAVVPAQTIAHGVAHIQIIEGHVQQTMVQGDADGAMPLLTKYGHAITQQTPLNMQTLERYVLLANDIPGMNAVKTVLQPPTMPQAPAGSTDIVMTPDFSKASGFVSYDNRGTKYLGQNELSAGGAVNSVIQSGDQFGLQGLTSNYWQGLRYINAYTNQPMSDTGSFVNLSGNYSYIQPQYLLTPLQVLGVSKEITLSLHTPWLRTRKQSVYTTIAVDWLNSKTDLQAFNANLYDDHVRSLRLGATDYLQDKWQGANQFAVQLSRGLPILGASSGNQPNLSRVNGDAQYTKLDASISRLQGITDHWSVYAAAIGQYAYDPLLASEQFAFGGTQFGQAYDPAELTGDHGVAAKTEVRYNMTPDWHYLNNIQYFAFYDIGKIWNRQSQAVTGLPQAQSGASTGVGARFGFNAYVFGSVEYAQPLTRQIATYQSFTPRIFVSLTFTGKTHA